MDSITQEADIDRLYVPRKEGGRWLMQVELAYIAETLNLVEYVENKEDPRLQKESEKKLKYKYLSI
jgi:hypothetical protein